MTKEQREVFAQLHSEASQADAAWEAYARLEAYVSQLVTDAYRAGRADECKAVRLWGVK